MLEYSDHDLKAAAQRVANIYAKIANLHFNVTLPIPVPIEFDLCDSDPGAAGMAHATMRIELNMILFRENIKHILNQTIPHEIAHLVQFMMFDLKGKTVQGHGAEWQEIMRKLGKDPLKYHQIDTSKAKQHFKKAKAAKKKLKG